MTGTIQQPDAGTAGQASPLVAPGSGTPDIDAPDSYAPDSDAPVRGAIHVSRGVVAKVAAQAASEMPEVGGASRGLGRLPGGEVLGGGGPDLGRRPKVTAHVDGTQAYLELVVSVRWPASVPRVTSALRRHVRERVQQLTGLQVGAVDIEVADLIADTAPMARVQ